MSSLDFESLVSSYLDGTATSEQVAALSRELESNDAARQTYLRMAHLHAALSADEGAAEREIDPARPVESSSPLRGERTSWTAHPWLLRAAAILAIGMAGMFVLRTKFRAAPAAHFAEVGSARWMSHEVNVGQGDAIPRGRVLELAAGTAGVRFASGAEVTLIGPAIFEVTGANSGFLTLGQLKAIAATPASKGFTVQTRTARVVDVGTEFVAAAAADGQSRVDVTSGEVFVLPNGSSTPHRLRTGDAFSVEAGQAQVLVRIESGDGTAGFGFPSIEPPSNQDYADVSRGQARVKVAAGTLHAGGPVPSGDALILLDGRGQSRADSPAESAFFDNNASGLLLLDLGRQIAVSKINTYSWHQSRQPDNRVRAVQKFTLYGYSGDKSPDLSDISSERGWVQLARVNSDDFFRVVQPIDRPAQQVCSITGAHGLIGRYRYLLWQVEPTQTLNLLHLNNTFYAEFDVYGDP